MKKRAKRNLSVYIRILAPIRAPALTPFVKANLTEREIREKEKETLKEREKTPIREIIDIKEIIEPITLLEKFLSQSNKRQIRFPMPYQYLFILNGPSPTILVK